MRFPFSTMDREQQGALSLFSAPWTATQAINCCEARERSVDYCLFSSTCSKKHSYVKFPKNRSKSSVDLKFFCASISCLFQKLYYLNKMVENNYIQSITVLKYHFEVLYLIIYVLCYLSVSCLQLQLFCSTTTLTYVQDLNMFTTAKSENQSSQVLQHLVKRKVGLAIKVPRFTSHDVFDQSE